MSSCKENNKLVGPANLLAWKKRIDLLLNENELMDYIKGNVTIPAKDQTQDLAKYNKDETRAQKILIESIKDPLIPYVSKLETSKEIYDTLVELFSVSTVGEVISLHNELYKMNFGLYAKLKKLESKPKMMWDQRSRQLLLCPREKGNLASLVHKERVREICPKSSALAARSMDTIRGIVLSSRKTTIRGNEKKPTLPKKRKKKIRGKRRWTLRISTMIEINFLT